MLDRTPIPVLGIVGGIGSGKSTVARWAAAQENVSLINGDEVGHAVLTRPGVADAIRARFGDPVIGPDGQVDRRALAGQVFGPKAEQQRALDDLERIVHPRIREIFKEGIAEAAKEGRRGVLLDAAVLFEAGWNDLCHAVVFVDVPRSHRLARLRENRGWDEAEVARRESSQASLESKRQRSQFIVDNSGTIEDAGLQLRAVISQVIDSSKR